MSNPNTQLRAAKMLAEYERVTDLLPILREAAAGRPIQHYIGGMWCDEGEGGAAFNLNASRYRAKPNPWQHCIDAQKAGKTIQMRTAESPTWMDGPWDMDGESPGTEYRIKHQWQECVDAQAAGKEIQFCHPSTGAEWRDFSDIPEKDRVCHEGLGMFYRIKPAKVFAGWKPVLTGGYSATVARWEPEYTEVPA